MQALRTERVNHAYLFSGPRGCGKTTSARILARCLNCDQGPTADPCGTCDSCVALARGGAGTVDVIEIDAASHGGVDDARDLRERASYGPAQSRYKIYIIDEAHMVTPQGFNALLKIVEEPPEHVKFIFATTEPDKVIGTIRSRTHHYPFRLVPPARLQAYMEEICAKEDVAVAPGVLSFVVRAGGGSVRDSLSVLDQLIAGSGPEGLTYESAAALLGFTDGELLDATVDALAAGDAAAVFRAIDRVVETGHDPRRFVEDLLERLRDLIVVAAVTEGAGSVLRHVPEDQLERMRRQAAAFGAGALSRAADVVNAGLTEMTGATAPRLQLELIGARILLPGRRRRGRVCRAARPARASPRRGRRSHLRGPGAAPSPRPRRGVPAPHRPRLRPRLATLPVRRPAHSPGGRPRARPTTLAAAAAAAAAEPQPAALARPRGGAPTADGTPPTLPRAGHRPGPRPSRPRRSGDHAEGPGRPGHRRAAPFLARRPRLAQPPQAGDLDVRRAERAGRRLRRPAGAPRHLDRRPRGHLPPRCSRRLRPAGPHRRPRGGCPGGRSPLGRRRRRARLRADADRRRRRNAAGSRRLARRRDAPCPTPPAAPVPARREPARTGRSRPRTRRQPPRTGRGSGGAGRHPVRAGELVGRTPAARHRPVVGRPRAPGHRSGRTRVGAAGRRRLGHQRRRRVHRRAGRRRRPGRRTPAGGHGHLRGHR